MSEESAARVRQVLGVPIIERGRDQNGDTTYWVRQGWVGVGYAGGDVGNPRAAVFGEVTPTTNMLDSAEVLRDYTVAEAELENIILGRFTGEPTYIPDADSLHFAELLDNPLQLSPTSALDSRTLRDALDSLERADDQAFTGGESMERCYWNDYVPAQERFARAFSEAKPLPEPTPQELKVNDLQSRLHHVLDGMPASDVRGHHRQQLASLEAMPPSPEKFDRGLAYLDKALTRWDPSYPEVKAFEDSLEVAQTALDRAVGDMSNETAWSRTFVTGDTRPRELSQSQMEHLGNRAVATAAGMLSDLSAVLPYVRRGAPLHSQAREALDHLMTDEYLPRAMPGAAQVLNPIHAYVTMIQADREPAPEASTTHQARLDKIRNSTPPGTQFSADHQYA